LPKDGISNNMARNKEKDIFTDGLDPEDENLIDNGEEEEEEDQEEESDNSNKIDNSVDAVPTPNTAGMPRKETKAEKAERVASLKTHLENLYGSAEARAKGEHVMQSPELDRANKDKPKLSKEEKASIATELKGAAHEADCRFARQWCEENQGKISIDLSQEQNPEVFYHWAKKLGAFNEKPAGTGEGRADMPNWMNVDYDQIRKSVKTLEALANNISKEDPSIAAKFFALKELNKKSNDLGDEVEALDLTGNKDLLEGKSQEWSKTFELRKKLYESINGQNTLDEKFAERTKNINDPAESQKEIYRISDEEFNRFAADNENLRSLYARSAEKRKNEIMAIEPSAKTPQEAEELKKQFGGPGINLANLPAEVAKSLTPAEAKAAGLPEGKPDASALEKFGEAAPEWALMILFALSGLWLLWAFKDIIPMAWEIGTKGYPTSLNNKISAGVDRLIKAINPE